MVRISLVSTFARTLKRSIGDDIEVGTLTNVAKGLIRAINNTIYVSFPTGLQWIFQSNAFQNNIFSTGYEAISMRGLTRTISNTVQSAETLRRKFSIAFSEVVEISPTFAFTRVLVRMVNKEVNIQSFRKSLRSIVKIIDLDMEIGELRTRLRGLIKHITTTVEIETVTNAARSMKKTISSVIEITREEITTRALTRMINDVIRVETFRARIREIIKMIDDDLEISATARTIVGKIKTIANIVNIGVLNTFQSSVFQTGTFTSIGYDFVKLMTIKRLSLIHI